MMLYETWLMVVGAGIMFSYMFTFEGYLLFIERFLNFKPFTCVLCLTFWCCIIGYYAIGLNTIYAIYSALIAELVYRKLVN